MPPEPGSAPGEDPSRWARPDTDPQSYWDMLDDPDEDAPGSPGGSDGPDDRRGPDGWGGYNIP